MTRFHFSLEKLLRFHRQRQKQAELIVARASGERDAARGEVERLQREIAAVCQLPERVGGPVEPVLREQSLRLAEQLSQTLRGATERLKLAEHHFREAQRQRLEVIQEVESLQLLRQQQWREHRDEVAHQQQVELDEIVMTRWARRSGTPSF